MIKKTFKQKVMAVLAEVRPSIQSHGGRLKLVSAEDGKVVIKISGACVGCPMTQATFGAGMEELIKEKVPEAKEIEFKT